MTVYELEKVVGSDIVEHYLNEENEIIEDIDEELDRTCEINDDN